MVVFVRSSQRRKRIGGDFGNELVAKRIQQVPRLSHRENLDQGLRSPNEGMLGRQNCKEYKPFEAIEISASDSKDTTREEANYNNKDNKDNDGDFIDDKDDNNDNDDSNEDDSLDEKDFFVEMKVNPTYSPRSRALCGRDPEFRNES